MAITCNIEAGPVKMFLRIILILALLLITGVPHGLLAISIPVWLASQGVSAGDIGSYLAVIVLPWAFKLVTGPFMDRYQFIPMGRRRPWVLGAQLGLSVSLLALMMIVGRLEIYTVVLLFHPELWKARGAFHG